MNTNIKQVFIAASAACLVSFGANAASFNIDDGSILAGSIPGANEDFSPENEILGTLGLPTSLAGFFGATVSLDEDAVVNVDVFGAEAAAENTIAFDKQSYTHDGLPWLQVATDLSSPLASFDVIAGAGALDFSFNSVFQGTDITVANGSNPDANTGPNFFATFGVGGDATATTGNSLWLFFDDNGIAGDNHDDLVVRLTINTVPLPASFLLLGGSLVGLTAMRRRRRA